MNDIKKEIQSYLVEYPPAYQVFEALLQVGDVYIMGGLLREYRDNGKINDLRDADFCVNIKKAELWEELLRTVPNSLNRFHGHKFLCSGFIIDVWDVKDTWAFKKQQVFACDGEYFNRLPETVFLNMDALAYDLKNDIWNDHIYNEAMKSKVLGIVLAENPFIELNIIRAMILRRKYNMKYSEELARIIYQQANVENFINQAMDIQIRRYGYSVIDREYIEEEIGIARAEYSN